MTAEVDVRRDADVNVVGSESEISKDDGDGSYVFVTGSDAESDLVHCGGAIEANGGEVEAEESVDVAVGDEENSGAELVTHLVEEGGDAAEEKASAVENKLDDEELGKEVGNEYVDEESEVAEDDKVDEEIASDLELVKENRDDVVLACDDVKETVSVSRGENKGSCETGGDVAVADPDSHLEAQIVNGIVADENKDNGLLTRDVQESVPESTVVADRGVDVAEKGDDESCDGNCQILAASGGDIQEESISEAIDDDGSLRENGHILAVNDDVKECVAEPFGTCEESCEILAIEGDVQENALESFAESINGEVSGDNGHKLDATVDVQESVRQLNTAENIVGSCEDNSQKLAGLHVEENSSEPIAEKINGSSEENGHNLAVKASVSQPIAENINGLREENSSNSLAVMVDGQESIVQPIAETINGSPEENGHMLAAKADSQKRDSEIIAEKIDDACEENDPGPVVEKVNIVREDDDQILAVNGDSQESLSQHTAEKMNGSLREENGQILVVNGDSQECISQHRAEKLNGSLHEGNGQTLVHDVDIKKEPEQLEPEVVDVLVYDKSGDESLIINAHEKSISAPIETDHLADTPEERGSCENGVVILESVELQKQLEAPVNGHIVHFQQDNISEENVPSEKASACENVPVENGESCAAVTDSSTIINAENEDSLLTEDDSTRSIDDGKPEQLDEKNSENPGLCPSEPSIPEVEGDACASNLKTECADDHVKPELKMDNLNEAILTNPGADEQSISDDKHESKEEQDQAVGLDGSSILTDDKPESEVASVNSLEGQDKVVEVEKRPFYYLIRVPRNDDENLKEQINLAQLQVEEKIRDRDAIRSKIQRQRATFWEHKLNFNAAISDERAAQELLKAKRREIDSAQVINNQVKDAKSVGEITNTIRRMEHTMSHETLTLKEEKQYIRDIKTLKLQRDKLSYSLDKQDQGEQSVHQRENIGKHIQDLKQEMDQLKRNLVRAQGVTQAARQICTEESNILQELQNQFDAADSSRQEAYVHLQSLKKQNYEKTKHFWRYRNDAKTANDLAMNGEKEQVQNLCIKQVESFMELWNTNADFRKDYIKCNTRSTIRRLRTLDGRSLGPDEEPPAMPDIVRPMRYNMAPAVVSAPEPAMRVVVGESEKSNDKSVVEITEPNNETAKNKEPVKVASTGISQATVSGRIETVEEIVEDPKPTREEIELARKEEELRKEEAAAQLREQRKLEEKAKAKDAMERKKKIAEKAQARAAIKAQKEAEEKEKEREKSAKKKERKKAKATNGIIEGESVPEPSSETTTETPVELEATEKLVMIAKTKRSQKMPQFTKRSKLKPIPLPLRNRSKRRMQTWMWVSAAIVAILGLFLLMTNGGIFSIKSMNLFH